MIENFSGDDPAGRADRANQNHDSARRHFPVRPGKAVVSLRGVCDQYRGSSVNNFGNFRSSRNVVVVVQYSN
jgi:hypothetical protein